MLDLWRGTFGDEYAQRNRTDPAEVVPVCQHILHGIEPGSALEVGCNRGHNLLALETIGWKIRGVEPNESARTEAHAAGLWVDDGDIRQLDLYNEGHFDLVLTAGVLIHVPPVDIHQAMGELVRVSNRYLLAIEYGAVEEEMVEYRGHRDICWRRPYGKLFECWFGLTRIGHDPVSSMLYPGCEWWLYAKA